MGKRFHIIDFMIINCNREMGSIQYIVEIVSKKNEKKKENGHPISLSL